MCQAQQFMSLLQVTASHVSRPSVATLTAALLVCVSRGVVPAFYTQQLCPIVIALGGSQGRQPRALYRCLVRWWWHKQMCGDAETQPSSPNGDLPAVPYALLQVSSLAL
jgi:hypothetical protein